MEFDLEKWMPVLIDYGIRLVGVIVLLFIVWLISGKVRKIVTKSLLKVNLDQTLAGFFGTVLKWTVLLLGIMACLSIFGIKTTSFAVVLGSAGLAIGLAFQGSLSNLASGVMLLIFRPFKVGDVVSIGGVVGKVKELDMFTTHIDTADNRRIICPNSNVFGSTIENVTFHATRRVDVVVGTDYTADLDKVREVLLTGASGVTGILEDPAPAVVLTGLGASSIDWSVRVWCNTEDYWPTLDATTRAVKNALDEAQIGIPFPQMDVHLNKLD